MQTILPTTPLTRWLTGYRSQSIRPGPRTTRELPSRRVLTASFSECGRITCLSGELWITRDGESQDIILRTGGTLACDSGSRIVVEALETATVEVSGTAIS